MIELAILGIYTVGWITTLTIAGQYNFYTCDDFGAGVREDDLVKYVIATFWPLILTIMILKYVFQKFSSLCEQWIRLVGRIAKTEKFRPVAPIQPLEKQDEFI